MGSDELKEAIQTAIQMEKDGHAFYTKAAAQTSSDMAATMFASIAKDELIHLETFKKMFEDQIGDDEYRTLERASGKYSDLPVFPKDLVAAEGLTVDSGELDALRFAMDAEKDAIDFYSKMRDSCSDGKLCAALDRIIEQEKSHFIILEGEFDHLSRTGYYFGLDVLGH